MSFGYCKTQLDSFFFGLLWQFVGGMLCSWSNYFTLAVPLSVLEPTYLRLVVGIFLKKLLLTDLVFVFSKFLVASYSSPSLNETEDEKFLSWWRWTDQATKYFETRKEDWLKELFLRKMPLSTQEKLQWTSIPSRESHRAPSFSVLLDQNMLDS